MQRETGLTRGTRCRLDDDEEFEELPGGGEEEEDESYEECIVGVLDGTTRMGGIRDTTERV